MCITRPKICFLSTGSICSIETLSWFSPLLKIKPFLLIHATVLIILLYLRCFITCFYPSLIGNNINQLIAKTKLPEGTTGAMVFPFTFHHLQPENIMALNLGTRLIQMVDKDILLYR